MSTNDNKNQEKDKKPHPANTLPLESVLEYFGADSNQDKQKDKWKLHGYGNILVKGVKWYNVNEETGGVGAISLTMHALGYPTKDKEGFKKALDLLTEEFSDAIDWDNPDYSQYTQSQSEPKKEFAPPERMDEFVPNVKDYLINTRQIPAYIIDKLVDDGLIYAGQYKNCIFLGPESAEVRSTENEFGAGFSGCSAGSDTENSGFIAPRMKKPENGRTILALGEAAIDALSYLALNPEAHAISSNGAGRFVLQYKLAKEAIENNSDIVFAFDADEPGDKAAQKVFNSFYVREYLARRYEIKRELIDEWLIDKKIKVVFAKKEDRDSKDMFFGLGMPFKKSSVTFIIDPENTDQSIHPDIEIDKEITIPMHPKGVNILLNQMNLKRARPILTKDWNEEWKARPKNMTAEQFKQKQKEALAEQLKNGEVKSDVREESLEVDDNISDSKKEDEPVVNERPKAFNPYSSKKPKKNMNKSSYPTFSPRKKQVKEPSEKDAGKTFIPKANNKNEPNKKKCRI